TGMWRASRAATKSLVAAGVEAVHREPGVGLSGIRLTWASRPASRRASALPRQRWSLTSLIIAYSIETRRPVTLAYSQAAPRTSRRASARAPATTCATISAADRFLVSPAWPVAQNGQPIPQPACDETHMVTRPG